MAPPRRSFDSYVNSVFGIILYGSLAVISWTLLPYILNVLLTILFTFLFFLQIFGLISEIAGYDWQQNPWTGEWSKME